MITKESIETLIAAKEAERSQLQQAHDAMVGDWNARSQLFQKAVSANQQRFQQLAGAIAQLTEMLKSFDPPPPEGQQP